MSKTRPLRLLQDCLERTAQACPDRTAIVSDSNRISYGELWRSSVRMANLLKSRGVARGDRVAIYLENGWECAVSIFGTVLADAAFVLINPQTKSDKLAFLLKDSGARVLIAESALWRFLRPALARLEGQPPHLVVTGMLPEGVRGDSLPTALAVASDQVPASANIPTDLASLIYTSGSTGDAKGVMHTHQSMRFAMESIVEYLEVSKLDRILCVLPLAFGYGLYQLLMAAHVGATLVIERSFAYSAQVFNRLESEQITVLPAVPTMYAMMLSIHDKSPLSFPNVRKITSAAAALPASFNRRLREVFPNAGLYRMYGLTECTRVSYLDPALVDEKPNSVGKAIPGTEIFLLDDHGRRVAVGQPGKLYVRGPHVMLGYWNHPEKTGQALVSGPWPGERALSTEDYFTVDADGCLYFVGRGDNIINCRGEKVSPAEVESVLYSLPGVREAAVIGVPDPIQGQAVQAIVSLNEGSDLDEQAIRKLCAGRLENYMVPSQVVLLQELPRNANGKIDSRTLAALFPC